MFDTSNLKDLALIVSSLTAAVTFLLSYIQYRRNQKMERIKSFWKIREDFRNDASVSKIIPLLDDDNPDLIDISLHDRFKFLGLYEEIALIFYSGVVKKETIHYMFGYYAIRCLESRNFWSGINKESYYWSLFVKFGNDMLRFEMSRPKVDKGI